MLQAVKAGWLYIRNFANLSYSCFSINAQVFENVHDYCMLSESEMTLLGLNGCMHFHSASCYVFYGIRISCTCILVIIWVSSTHFRGTEA